MVPNIEQLRRVGGTAAGGYYEVEPRVLLAWPADDYRQSESGARASLEESHRIARERGASHVTIVLVDRVSSQDAGARRVWRDEIDPALVSGLVLVCSSRLSRAIGSFFIGLSRPMTPTVMVPSFEDAVHWAKHRLDEIGDADG